MINYILKKHQVSEENVFFSIFDVGKTGYQCEKKQNFHPYLTPYANINLKWIINQKIKHKNIKLLEENTDYLHALKLAKIFFLDKKSKASSIKENTNYTSSKLKFSVSLSVIRENEKAVYKLRGYIYSLCA